MAETISAFALLPIWDAGTRVSVLLVLAPEPGRKSLPMRLAPDGAGVLVRRGAGAEDRAGVGAGVEDRVGVGVGVLVRTGRGCVVGRVWLGGVVVGGGGANCGRGSKFGGDGRSDSVGACAARLSETGSGAVDVRPTSSVRLTTTRSGGGGGRRSSG